jgi:hypothetical protein
MALPNLSFHTLAPLVEALLLTNVVPPLVVRTVTTRVVLRIVVRKGVETSIRVVEIERTVSTILNEVNVSTAVKLPSHFRIPHRAGITLLQNKLRSPSKPITAPQFRCKKLGHRMPPRAKKIINCR